MGDFGSATEAARIIDLFALKDYAKNLDCCNFRVLQHNPPKSGHYCGRPLRAPEAAIPLKAAFDGGFNWSAQHTNLLAKMGCGA